MRKILSLILGLLFTISANAACNLYNKANGALTGYPSEGMKWTTGGSEKSILIKLTEGETYTIRRVDGSAAVLRIAASSTDTLTAGQSLQRIYIGSKDDTVKTFSVPDGYPYVLIYIYNTNGNTITSTQAINGFMIVKGSEIPDEYIPYDAACIDRCKNLFDSTGVTDNYFISPDGTFSAYAGFGYTQLIPVEQNTSYTLSGINGYGSSTRRIHAYNNNGEWIAQIAVVNLEDESEPYSVTGITPTNTAYIRVSYAISDTNVQLELGDTATEYVPYNAACHNNKIKIATTKYNESAFSPLNTALANAISVVDSVVSNTITQAGRIATLQTQKQTRPNDIADDNEKCPAGKKCLLVTDTSGIPHWYEIVEQYSRLPDGYTELQYIESTGTQYIDTGVVLNSKATITTVGQFLRTSSAQESVIAIWGFMGSSGNLPRWGSGIYTSAWLMALNATDGDLSANTDKHTFVNETNGINKYNSYVDGTSIYGIDMGTNYPETYQNNTLSAYLFARNNNNTARNFSSSRVYSYNIVQNNVEVINLIPARRNSDNVVGMYDTVSGQFFTNQGTGEFIAGAPVAE